MTERITLPHLLLGLAAIAVWGSNFVVIRLALGEMPPLLFAALRFTFAVLPAIAFVRRPPVPWANLAAYGLLIGAGQFGLLFIAMRASISPGLASLVIQTQVFFTIMLAVLLSGERVTAANWAGLLLGAAGIAVIGAHGGASATPFGLLLVLLAALCWAGGNMVARRRRVNMLGYVVWASLFSVPPLVALTLLLEGGRGDLAALAGAGWAEWGAVAWQSFGNALFGFGVWGFLLARYPAAVVSPLALLVPVVGMGTSALWLGEPLPAWKLLAALLVISGLAVNLLLPRLLRAVQPGRV
jgi:O-acetylserine/cysteine efflux transporter